MLATQIGTCHLTSTNRGLMLHFVIVSGLRPSTLCLIAQRPCGYRCGVGTTVVRAGFATVLAARSGAKMRWQAQKRLRIARPRQHEELNRQNGETQATLVDLHWEEQRS